MAILTYPGVVLADSPEIFLRLDEPSGTMAADSSGNGRDFAHNGSPTLDQSGPVNKAVSYNGSNQHTTYSGSTSGFISYPFTMIHWAKTPSSPGSNAFFCGFSLANSGDDNNLFFGALRTQSGDLYASLSANTTTAENVRIPNGLKNKFVHLAIVRVSASDQKIYANGVLVYETTTTNGASLSPINRITAGGIQRSSAIYHAGYIAEPQIFNSELSAEEIGVHHAVGRGFTDDASFEYAAMVEGPSIYYQMQDVPGVPQDSSGWERHATNEGSPTYGSNGRAITYDGSDDASVLAADDLGITDYPATILMMAKTPAAPASGTSFSRLMFGDDGTEDNYFGMDLTTDGGGTINARGLLETGGTADHVTGSTGLTADTFYLVAWRLVSATERYLYVDGSQEASDTDSRAWGSNINDLVLGRDLAGTPNYIEGTKAHILAYNRDIGTTAISDLATKSSGIADAGQTFQHSLTDSISVQDILNELTTLSDGKSHSMITVPFDWGTPDGNLDITTTSEIGGDDLPIAAVFMYAGVSAVGISDSDSEISIGLFDGENQVVLGGGERNNVDLSVGNTSAKRQFRDDSVMLQVDGRFGTANRQASGVEFILNGVRINVPSDYGSNQKGFVTLFFDPGGQAEVGVYDPHDTQDSSVTVTPGFSTDAIISLGSRSQIDNTDTALSDMMMSLGFAVNGGNQASLLRYSDNANGATQVTQSRLQNNRGAIVELAGPYIEYGTFTTTGFDATTRDAAAGSDVRIGYLALSMPNTSLHAGVLDTPTSVDDLDVETPAVPADGALFGTSNVETANATTSGGSPDPTGYGWAVGSADDFGGMATIGAANARQSPTETEEFFVTSLLSTAANDVHKVEATTFDTIPLGFRLGFGTVHTTAKKWIFLAAEGENINTYEKTIIDGVTFAEQLILQFLQTITEDFTIGDSLSIRWVKNLVDDIGIDDAISTIALFNNTLTEGLELSEDLTGSLVAINRVTDTLSLDEALTNKAVLHQTIQEAVAIQIGLNLGDETYTGLVLNTRNLALTKYSGYNFNSFARIGDKYYGAADDGIYLLEGDDDNGTDIEAHLRTAVFDFNSDFQKRVPRAYLGLRGDGEVYLKAITNEEEVHWYRIQDVQEKFENNRVRMGRGVTSEYWQFELANVDGSFFELHDMTLIPVVLTRRVK